MILLGDVLAGLHGLARPVLRESVFSETLSKAVSNVHRIEKFCREIRESRARGQYEDYLLATSVCLEDLLERYRKKLLDFEKLVLEEKNSGDEFLEFSSISITNLFLRLDLELRLLTESHQLIVKIENTQLHSENLLNFVYWEEKTRGDESRDLYRNLLHSLSFCFLRHLKRFLLLGTTNSFFVDTSNLVFQLRPERLPQFVSLRTAENLISTCRAIQISRRLSDLKEKLPEFEGLEKDFEEFRFDIGLIKFTNVVHSRASKTLVHNLKEQNLLPILHLLKIIYFFGNDELFRLLHSELGGNRSFLNDRLLKNICSDFRPSTRLNCRLQLTNLSFGFQFERFKKKHQAVLLEIGSTIVEPFLILGRKKPGFCDLVFHLQKSRFYGGFRTSYSFEVCDLEYNKIVEDFRVYHLLTESHPQDVEKILLTKPERSMSVFEFCDPEVELSEFSGSEVELDLSKNELLEKTLEFGLVLEIEYTRHGKTSTLTLQLHFQGELVEKREMEVPAKHTSFQISVAYHNKSFHLVSRCKFRGEKQRDIHVEVKDEETYIVSSAGVHSKLIEFTKDLDLTPLSRNGVFSGFVFPSQTNCLAVASWMYSCDWEQKKMSLALHVDLPWPLNLIFSLETLHEFSQIFNFFLQLRHCTTRISRCLLERRENSSMWRRLHKLRYEVAFFLSNLANFLQNDVVHMNFVLLEQKISSAESFEEIQRPILHFLLTVRRETLITSKLVLSLLTKIFEIAIEISDMIHKFSEKKAGKLEKKFHFFREKIFSELELEPEEQARQSAERFLLRLNYNRN